MPMADGTYKYAIKTCGDSMMYNPNAMVTIKKNFDDFDDKF
jgi:hypothetical protein